MALLRCSIYILIMKMHIWNAFLFNYAKAIDELDLNWCINYVAFSFLLTSLVLVLKYLLT